MLYRTWIAHISGNTELCRLHVALGYADRVDISRCMIKTLLAIPLKCVLYPVYHQNVRVKQRGKLFFGFFMYSMQETRSTKQPCCLFFFLLF